jgi:hypothetical protein
MTKTFKGSTSECLSDLFRSYQPDSLNQFLSESIGVAKDTTRGWRKGTLPVGKTLLFLRVYLDLFGYRVDEFSSFDDELKQFAQLLALRLISLEEAAETLEYRTGDGIYHFLLHGGFPSKTKEYRLRRIVHDFGEALCRELLAKQAQINRIQPDPNNLPATVGTTPENQPCNDDSVQSATTMDTDRQAAADTPPDPEPATPAYDEVLARGLACQLTSACNS